MQPLKTTARPSSGSTIGWAAASDRSMIESRRWPSGTQPPDHDPAPSAPLDHIASLIRSTVAKSARPPSTTTSPAIPHMIPPHGHSGVLAGLDVIDALADRGARCTQPGSTHERLWRSPDDSGRRNERSAGG